MIRGRFTPELYPLVTIEIADGNGAFHSLDVILDTGFDGELALPSDVIGSLGIPHRAEIGLVLGSVDICEIRQSSNPITSFPLSRESRSTISQSRSLRLEVYGFPPARE